MTRLIIAIVGFVISIAIFVVYTKKTFDETKVIQAEIAQYDQALTRTNELQKKIVELVSTLNAFDPNDLARLEKLLPNHVDNVRLLLDLDSLAGRYGLVLKNVNVEKANTNGGDGTITVGPQSSGTAASVIGAQAGAFESLTFSFATEGTYLQFVEFIEALERSLRIVDIETLSLSRGAGGERSAPQDLVYSFDVSLRTYWLK